MRTNTTLNILEYILIVENIAKEYFNSNHEYTPHYGQFNVMRLFYNYCVIDDIADLSHDFTDAMQVQKLVDNDEFIKEFDSAIECEKTSLFNFTNAYHTAMEIVEERKNNISLAVEALKMTIGELLDNISNSLSQENIDKFAEIAKEIAKGKLSADSIVNAVGTSDVFQKIISDKEAE